MSAGPGPRAGAGAGPGFFDFLWGPGRVIFGSASKFAARGANRHLIWSRERPNQAIFQIRPNLRQARNTLGIEPGLGRRKTRPWAPGNGSRLFPQEKPAWERRGLAPRGLCASEIFWNHRNPLKTWKVWAIRLWASDPGGLWLFFSRKTATPKM